MTRFLAVVLLWSCCTALAQTSSAPPSSAAVPILADLIRPLNSESLQVGDPVLLKLESDWSDGSCKLQAASVLHGAVRDAGTGKGSRSRVALSFRYSCPGKDPQKLVWLALIAPDPNAGDPIRQQTYRSSSFGEGGGLGSAGNTQSNPVDLSGRQNPGTPISFPETNEQRKSARPTAIRTGQVWKLPHLKLEVGAGPEASTVLASTGNYVKLPLGSVLVLLPESAALRSTPPDAVSDPSPAEAAVPKASTRKLPPEIAPCFRPACTVASAFPPPQRNAFPLRTISLASLGYRRLSSAERLQLQFSSAIAFLGENQVLFTFYSHELIHREQKDRPEDRPHAVRAVLFNTESGKQESSAQWRIRNAGQYLWGVDGTHIVVHDGDRLRWLGPDLREEQVFNLGGPLAFFRMSPDSRHYAVGVVRELHTPAEHLALLENDAAGPEERVDTLLLNAHMEIEGRMEASSRAMPPVLLNGGRIELRRALSDLYYLREYPWSQGREPRDFARMRSSCLPGIQVLSAFIMAEGCKETSNDHWLHIFREDGTPVLESTVPWRAFSPLTAAAPGAAPFALAALDGGGDYVRGSVFHETDLSRETVEVRRSGDGGLLFATRMQWPLPAHQPMAFSPGGDRIAIIDGQELVLYALPAASPAP